jgi:uncharacterized damage-inducible protein DinB
MGLELLATELTRYAAAKIRQNLTQIVRCVRLLSAEQVWHRASEHSNSIGNLLLHLAGNLRQWIVAGLGGEAFARDRPSEFAARGGIPVAELSAELEQAVDDALALLAQLDAAGLAAGYTIQGYDVSGVVATCHVVEHFSWHTGQIVYMTKLLTGAELTVYDSAGHKPSELGGFP